jgi:phage tail-like protein
MAITRDYPYSNHCFLVEIGGEPLHGAIEVVLPDMMISFNGIRPGDGPVSIAPQNVSKPVYTNCIIRRGYQGHLDLYQWWRAAADGGARNMVHRNVTIKLTSEDRQASVTTWILFNAVPARYFFSPLQSKDGAALVESLEIAFESIGME